MNSTTVAARVWAIVPAAGRGDRFRGDDDSPSILPKQYSPLCGATVIEWALRPLILASRIEAIVVAIAAADPHWPRVAARLDADSDRLLTVNGGATRAMSVLNALGKLQSLAGERDWVLVHDAARPCLSDADLARLLACLEGQPAGAVLAAPIADTIKRESQGISAGTVDRAGLWRALTPQVFRFGQLHEGLLEAQRNGIRVSDEAQAMEAIGLNPILVPGSIFNIKVTHVEDLGTAQSIILSTQGCRMRIGQGLDVHAFADGDHVMLGGVRIAHTHGILAHSDGDVIIHALCDAIYGALGLGDIGTRFPDTDRRYRGADSRMFLRDAAAQMRSRGFAPLNVDVTVLAQAPRVTEHRANIAANLAHDLGIDAALVNIKATTTEGLGFVGRREGIGASVVILLSGGA